MEDDRLINRRGNRIDPAEALVQGFSGLKIIKPQIGRTLADIEVLKLTT